MVDQLPTIDNSKHTHYHLVGQLHDLIRGNGVHKEEKKEDGGEMENTQELTKDQASLLLNNWRDKPQTYIDQILGVQKIWKLQDQLLNTLNRAMDEHKPIYIGLGSCPG